MANLLIVDDERSICEVLEIAFRKDGHSVETVQTVAAARQKLQSKIYDIVVSDIKMPQASGLELLQHVRNAHPDTLVILLTGYGELETAMQAVKMGAFDYIIKNPSQYLEELKVAIDRALETSQIKAENVTLKRELKKQGGLDNIVGQSPPMKALFELIESVAPTQSTVLILGESGTGKELVARAIHSRSQRCDKPFVSINCSAFQETLLESELFGYRKGAFTGANSNKKGLFEYSSCGTLFLDEIGEMSLPMQVKLLRAVQERKIRPVGGNEEIEVDVRLLAASNRDLQNMVQQKQFREDLYYRISVIPIHIPPLRKRPSDIPLLAFHFLEKFNQQMGKTIRCVAPETIRLMEKYPWPGNVREMEHAIERAVALEKGSEISPNSLPERVIGGLEPRTGALSLIDLPEDGIDLEKHIQEIERNLLEAALIRAKGVRTRAADLLKMSYRSFRHYASKYGI
ncbi:MAG: sigma-54-dependent Fis family transcriptional regulator [Acidobacteria bacterium]|nr:sigma-54-dependent Fis family transcriptional regulator [Acidobacteriota bacterium]